MCWAIWLAFSALHRKIYPSDMVFIPSPAKVLLWSHLRALSSANPCVAVTCVSPAIVVSLSGKGTRADQEKQLPLVFGLAWPCPASAPWQYYNKIFFSSTCSSQSIQRSPVLELLQKQTSFSHWCNARESSNEPIRGKVGQCASGVINGIQEGGGECLSQSFQLSGQ